MSAFVFAPGVKVYIETAAHGILDVSEDLTRGAMQRVADEVSGFQFGLNNVRRKYDGVFSPNDRIVVMMKRLTWMRTFTGYLNTTPRFSIWPREIQMTASCSIKRLKYYYWDPNLQSSQNLVYNSLRLQSDGSAPDGGIKQVVINLLEEVVDWSASKALGDAALAGSRVHIGGIPAHWYNFAAKAAAAVVANQREEAALALELLVSMGASATIAGVNQPSGAVGAVTPDVYAGLRLDQTQADLAGIIVATTLNEGLTHRDAEFAIGCVLQESMLRNLTGGDRDSVGLFQQRPSQGWGTVAECRDPVHATKSFLKHLKGISNRYSMSFTAVIQQVQRSGYPNAYAKWEPAAKAIVDKYVASSATGPSTTSGAAIQNGVALDGSTANSPQTAGKTSGAHMIGVARQLVAKNVPYEYGSTAAYNNPNPPTLDCTAFIEWVYYQSLGLAKNGGMPTESGALYLWAISNGGQKITPAQAFQIPGALVFRGSAPTPEGIGHVEMVVNGAETIGTRKTGTNASAVKSDPSKWDYACTLPNVEYPPGAVAPSSAALAETGGGVSVLSQLLSSSSAGVRDEEGSALADSLFGSGPWVNYVTWGNTGFATDLIGIRALQNDEPILPYITNLMNSTMRQFCSAPNGDFMAWFPDYYGLWGTAAKMVLEPIEVKDFTVDWSDEALVTHQFVQGVQPGAQSLDLVSGEVSVQDPDTTGLIHQFVSAGIATVDMPDLMAMIFGTSQSPLAQRDFLKEVYERFGARPSNAQFPGITGFNGEFFMAVFLFMQAWTYQYTANIELTFMPELWPGMLIQFPAYNFQAYVVQVEHNFAFGEGGGFSTRINIAAPARIKDIGPHDKLAGLPIAGPLPETVAEAKKNKAKVQAAKGVSTRTGSVRAI